LRKIIKNVFLEILSQMLDLISNFFDTSFKLDSILKENDLNNKTVKNHISTLKIILQKSIKKAPSQNHPLFREKIAFYHKAFNLGKKWLKTLRLLD
jgi:hypothetical protein